MCILKYAPVHTTLQLVKKTSCMVNFIVSIGLRSRTYYFILLIILLSLYPFQSVNGNDSRLFYARLDIQYSNNRIKKSNLLLIPAENDFRPKKLTPVVISGTAGFSHNNPELSIETRAADCAIQLLLEKHGLKSLKSKLTTFNNSTHSDIVMSYEGYVNLPWKIIKKQFDKKNKLCTITIEIEFAPATFPDKWKMQRFKYKIKQLFKNFILLFK